MEIMGPGEVFGLIAVGAAVTLYFFLKARHAERMAMIEKGIINEKPPQRSTNLMGVKIGMLLFGLGFGLAFAFFVVEIMGTRHHQIYPALMLLFGGASLVASYFVELRLIKKEEY